MRLMVLAVIAAALLAHVAAAAASGPIAAYCESRGGSVAVETNANGSTTDVCVLKDGTRINALAYFRNQHRR